MSDLAHEGAAYPILEFDPTPEAIIEPSKVIKARDVPQHAVACFFQDVITQLSQEHTVKVVMHLKSEIGRHPVYELDLQGRRLAVFHPGVGAPLAAAFLEEMIAIGPRLARAVLGETDLERARPLEEEDEAALASDVVGRAHDAFLSFAAAREA